MSETPQSNLYLAQNGKWLNDPENKIPDEYSSWGSFTKLHDSSLKKQIKILDDLQQSLADKNLSVDEKKLAYVYQKNMQKFQDWDNNKGNYDPIKSELENMNSILNSNYHVTDFAKYGGYCIMNGISFPIDVDKDNELEDSDHVKLEVSPSSFILPSREYYFDDNFSKQRQYLKEHLQKVEQLMNKNNIKLVDNFVDNVLEFEKYLAYISMTNAQQRLYDEYYTKTTLEGFYNKLSEHNFVKDKLDNYEEGDKNLVLDDKTNTHIKDFMETLYYSLNLREHMTSNYKKTYDDHKENPDNAFVMMAFDGDYLKRILNYLVDSKHSNVLRAHFQYSIISSMSGYCTKELNEEFFDFCGRKLHDQKEQKPYDKRSTGVVNMWLGELMGQIYVKKHFSSDSKKEIKNMISSILDVMKQSLEQNDWLTQETKEKALVKLSTFVNKIGFPDEWKDYSQLEITEEDTLNEVRNKVKRFFYKTEFLDKLNTRVNKNEWHMSPQTVNAYYSPQLNEVVFPAAILQPPFYQTTYDTIDMELEDASYYENLGFDPLVPINHGGILAVIAHEITHGFDDSGKKFDSQGNMAVWWKPEDDELFAEKILPMTDQVEQFEFIDSEKKKHSMNAKLTMGENLADLGGLTLSLKAMMQYKDATGNQIYNNPEALKLFFKSWANVWKSNNMEQSKIQRLVSDPHAPPDFRANLVKNIDQFHEVFNVKETDSMYLHPSKRVIMW